MNENLRTYLVTLSEDDNARTCIHFICQAEDDQHATEQTMDMYPQGRITNVLKSPKPGDKVWWNDPDEDASSGHYQVLRVCSESGAIEYADTMVVLKNHHGSIAEVYASELNEEHSIECLADDVLNSESNEGCAADYTIVKRSWLMALIEEIRGANLTQRATALKPTQQALTQAMQYSEHHEKFVLQVAGLNIWGYDKDCGNPYQECDEPDEGHADSHACLMALIEQARKL